MHNANYLVLVILGSKAFLTVFDGNVDFYVRKKMMKRL